MAKNFPFFKFIATEWLTGDIVYESLDVQGLFINICALYWQRDGNLSIEDIDKRYKQSDLLAKLTDRFFSVKDGFISVHFLDEQLVDAGHISKVNSENGKKGGRPKVLKTLEKKPTAKRPLSEPKAKKSKEEQEVNNKEIYFDTFWSFYPNKVAKEKCKAKFLKLEPDEITQILATIQNWAKYKPFESYSHPNPETYLNQKRWQDVIPEVKKVYVDLSGQS